MLFTLTSPQSLTELSQCAQQGTCGEPKGIYPGMVQINFVYDGKVLRTTCLIDILRYNGLMLKEKRLLFIDDNTIKNNRFAECARDWI